MQKQELKGAAVAARRRSGALLRRVVRHRLIDVTLFAECKEAGPAILAVCFGEKTGYGGREATDSSHPELVKYDGMVRDFLDGTRKSLSPIPLDLSKYSQFSRDVLLGARSVPWGSAVSYTELARLAGNPRACRAAASVMRHNPFPLIVPCHRVIKSDGSIGGFMGSQRGRAIQLKRKLLEREGIATK